MSISKVHDLLQNKGCIWTVSLLMVLGVVGTGMTQCGRANEFNERMQSGPATTIAIVDGHEITDRLIDREVERNTAAYAGMNLPPTFTLGLTGDILRSATGYVAQIELAKKYGIEASEEDLEKLVAQNLDDELGRLKQSYITGGKLKPDATEADFAALFKKEQGISLDQAKERAIEMNRQVLQSGKDLQLPVAALAVGQPLIQAIKKEIKLTDEELKKTYDTYEFKRITLINGDTEALAKKIIQELKGGLSFEKAIDRYSQTPPTPNKKLSEQIDPLSLISIRGFEAYQPLEKLKPGEVSEPITIRQSTNIFKLIRIKNELPKDFDKKKDTYRETQLSSLAAQKLQAELMKRQENAKIEWKSRGHQLVYEFGRTQTENLSTAERNKIEKQVLKDALAEATSGEPASARIAGTLAYAVLQTVYSKATPEEKKQLDKDKLQVYEIYLQDKEDADMRLELVKIYKDQKKPDEFAKQLEAAANANYGRVDAAGQAAFSAINKYIKEGQDAKLLTAEQVKEIQDIQTLWKQQKADEDKAAAEAKKIQDEMEKKNKEEVEKAKKKATSQIKTRDEFNKDKSKPGGNQ